jgi:uncharacterized membrane protein
LSYLPVGQGPGAARRGASLIVVCILLFTRWKGGELVFRHRVVVYDEPK